MNNTSNSPTNQPHQLVMVHGRGFKPQADVLKRLWIDSLRAGLSRDFPDDLGRFDGLHTSMIY
ncbi:MAG: hypothetical protein O3A63_20375 [Proteobacteria bacterium]|nr:hypothetical protein [Pseudomonadota bacterium]